MIDGHIHIERGPYTLEWIRKFVDRAVETGLDEIRLLEHNFRFEEYVPMYDSVCAHSDFVNEWFHRVGGVKKLDEYHAARRIGGRFQPPCQRTRGRGSWAP